MSWELQVKRHPRTTGRRDDVKKTHFDNRNQAEAEAQRFSERTNMLQTEDARDQIYMIEKDAKGKVLQSICYAPHVVTGLPRRNHGRKSVATSKKC